MMKKAINTYTAWRTQALPPDLAAELMRIEGDPEEIYDRFCRDINFGTSGLRGKMGAGTNRINSVVLRRATMGVADYLLARFAHPAVVISYDTRIYSRGYADDVAETLAECGIDVYLMTEPQPVPLLSFAVRKLGLSGGIMITASHNPREYNGYKVYDHHGSQICDEMAREIEACINRHAYFEEKRGVPQSDAPRDDTARAEALPCGQIRPAPAELIDAYRNAISALAVWWDEDEARCRKEMERLSVVYTPLNGTGLSHVTEIFRRLSLHEVRLVQSQTPPNGSFPTCPSPNPESMSAFKEALTYYDQYGADLIIATDPDCDRMGVLTYHRGHYVQLSGNEVGELMLDYLCRQLTVGKGKAGQDGRKLYKSIVTSPLAERIAADFGLEVVNTLTGFKNIAAGIDRLAEQQREDDFFFGFEESLGYLYGTYTRDKDGVMASQLICLAAAFWKTEGRTLVDRLGELRQIYGFMETVSSALTFSLEKDRQTIEKLLSALAEGKLQTVLGCAVQQDDTYLAEQVFQGSITDEAGRRHKFIVRPSGTELKLKIYVFAEGAGRYEAKEAADRINKEITAFLQRQIKELTDE